jgi:hypothetical protein
LVHSDSFRLGKVEDRINEIKSKALPDTVPDDLLEFIAGFRPMIGKKPLNFKKDPFWIEPLRDPHPHQMYVNGRQTYKTTNCSSLIAKIATRQAGCEVTYVADDDNHRTAFSEQRLRQETFQANPKLANYLPHGKANVGRIKLTNGSVIYLGTDENKYHFVEGKSNAALILDEAQAQEVGFLPVAMYSMSKTHGRFYCFGIGGEAGSDYYKMWKRTDQREWVYDDPDWRDKLQFDAFGEISNPQDELNKILAGKWVAQNPTNTQYRGYHFPQRMFPHIPLTIHDAVTKYHVQPELSIEYQEKHYPRSMFLSHCEGEFYKAERRPITPDMVEHCYVNYMKLLSGDEVRDMKALYGTEITVLGGVDFGSGPAASKTVISIVIHWRKSNRFQLAWIDPRPTEHPMDQARYIADLLHDYDVDFAVGDWGYGQDQIPVIQGGGRDSQDNKFLGLGLQKFMGCQTIGNEVKQNAEFSQKYDDRGNEEKQKIQIDKTTVIQNFVDFIGMNVAHPLYPFEEKFKKSMFIIPHYYDWQTDFLMDDMTAITRKDLDEVQEVRTEDPRQRARKEYNHPPDSVMSIIYCLVANQNYNPSAYLISAVKRGKRNRR